MPRTVSAQIGLLRPESGAIRRETSGPEASMAPSEGPAGPTVAGPGAVRTPPFASAWRRAHLTAAERADRGSRPVRHVADAVRGAFPPRRGRQPDAAPGQEPARPGRRAP